MSVWLSGGCPEVATCPAAAPKLQLWGAIIHRLTDEITLMLTCLVSHKNCEHCFRPTFTAATLFGPSGFGISDHTQLRCSNLRKPSNIWPFPHPPICSKPFGRTASVTSVQSSLTLVKVLGGLAGVATAVGATFLLSRAFAVVLAALHAGRRKAAGPFRRQAGALLHLQHRLEELTAGHALPVLPGESPLVGMEAGKEQDGWVRTQETSLGQSNSG